jgi:hypothetical protein
LQRLVAPVKTLATTLVRDPGPGRHSARNHQDS